MSYQEQTPSGIPVRPVYGPGDRPAHEPPPGQFPFTRGNFATGYRGRLWTFRQYSRVLRRRRVHQRRGAADLATYELDPGGRDRQLKRLAQVKHDRDQVTVQATLTKLKAAAEGTENLMGPLIDCANAYCTVGEMVATLKDVWGEFQQPVVF
jgi:methylmalonyl-CoA mutase N-terminal domain/subunit